MSLSAVAGASLVAGQSSLPCRTPRDSVAKVTSCQYGSESSAACGICRSKPMLTKSGVQHALLGHVYLQVSKPHRRDLVVTRVIEEAVDRKTSTDDILINGTHSWKELMNGSGHESPSKVNGNGYTAVKGFVNGNGSSKVTGKGAVAREGKPGSPPQELLTAIQGSRSRLQALIKKASNLLESEALERPVRTQVRNESSSFATVREQTAEPQAERAPQHQKVKTEQAERSKTSGLKSANSKPQRPAQSSASRPPRPSFSPRRLARPSTPSAAPAASSSEITWLQKDFPLQVDDVSRHGDESPELDFWEMPVGSSGSAWYTDCRDCVTCADENSMWYIPDGETQGPKQIELQEQTLPASSHSSPILVDDFCLVGEQLDPVTSKITNRLRSVLEDKKVWEEEEKPLFEEQVKMYELQVELLEMQMASIQQMVDASQEQYVAELEAKAQAYEATLQAVDEAEKLQNQYEQQSQHLHILLDKLSHD